MTQYDIILDNFSVLFKNNVFEEALSNAFLCNTKPDFAFFYVGGEGGGVDRECRKMFCEQILARLLNLLSTY